MQISIKHDKKVLTWRDELLDLIENPTPSNTVSNIHIDVSIHPLIVKCLILCLPFMCRGFLMDIQIIKVYWSTGVSAG